jgi:uncharacterized protein (TIGR03663 family)
VARVGSPRWLLLALAWAALLGLSLWLRLPGLADKPLHYDEGVNGWLTLRLHWWDLYRYDPTNYHGPFLHYANLVGFAWLGPSETSLRLATAVAGALVPLALLPARRFAGDAALLAAGLALAVGPGFVYFSRTSIHEIHLVAFTALWAAALARYAAAPGSGSAVLAAAAAALAFATKETALLTAGGLGAGAGLAWLAGRPAPRAAADLFGGRSRRETLRAWTLGARRAWLAGALVFASLLALFYSSFGTHPRGIVDFFAGFAPWTEYAVTGRNQSKAFGYYALRVMPATLGAWRLVAIPAAALALATRDRLGLALLGWGGATLLAYSVLPYKTPWCELEIDLPLLLLVAWAVGRAARVAADASRPRALRAAAAAAALAALAPAPRLAAESLADNLERFDDFQRPFVYYQTLDEFHEMLRDLFGVADAAPGADDAGPRVLNVDLEFPLGFYTLTRGWALERTTYLERAPTAAELDGADVVVSTHATQEAIDALVAARPERWHREKYFHRPGTYAYAWYREPLWERYQASGGRAASPWPRPARLPLPAPPVPKGGPRAA